MLVQPNSTPYDLKFQVAGVPVRVHPFFWLAALLLGFDEDFRLTLIWVAIVFVSILVHEMGHARASTFQGLRASVVMFWMGGLCFSDREALTLPGRLTIIAAGPAAGLLLGGLTLFVGYAWAGFTPADILALFDMNPGGLDALYDKVDAANISYLLLNTYYQILYVNIFWSLLNMLPLWYLDGGQFTAEILTRERRGWGMRLTHQVSIGIAGVLAVLMLLRENLFLTVFFALFAYLNYQGLQALSSYGSAWEDPADWWRR